ncbi:MAG: sugar transferase [Acidimicrobiales bacterium]
MAELRAHAPWATDPGQTTSPGRAWRASEIGLEAEVVELRHPLASPPPPSAYITWIKPAIDRVIAAALLLATLPVLLMVLGLVRVNLGPGVIFRQRRVGRHGEVFTIYKVRTMRHPRPGERGEPGRPHKSSDDPRHTPLGRVLRRWSLDELPQLWNVLKGDMSLIGPRPELVEIVERHRLWKHPRHHVKPGITGVWQVSPFRTRLLHESVDVDLDYLRRVTLGHDVTILARTLGSVVRRTGA